MLVVLDLLIETNSNYGSDKAFSRLRYSNNYLNRNDFFGFGKSNFCTTLMAY